MSTLILLLKLSMLFRAELQQSRVPKAVLEEGPLKDFLFKTSSFIFMFWFLAEGFTKVKAPRRLSNLPRRKFDPDIVLPLTL